MANRSRKSNALAYKLLKQTAKANEDFREYGVKPIRFGSLECLGYLGFRERPMRTRTRSWKAHRANHWK